MKYTFICNYGKNRSPTAARVSEELAQERDVQIKADFLALYPEESEAYEQKEAEKLKQSDRIFVMTPEIGETVMKRYHVPKDKIICLEIEDNYDCHGIAGPKMKAMLTDILRKKLDKWIR